MKGEHDLVVYGATPAGIACAVRAARDGVEVLLLHHHRHIGGMLANGLGTLDTLYEGPRSPLFDELHQRLVEHCRLTYGAGSPEHEAGTVAVATAVQRAAAVRGARRGDGAGGDGRR